MSNLLGSSERMLRAGIAGPICSIVSLAFSLSYAALIFSGPLADYLPFGMAATFIATAIGASAMALRSSLPFALAAPDVSTSAMTAALISTFVGHLASEGLGENLLSTTLILLSLSAALTGVLLCGLGLARFGRVIRFVPFPVIGGFLASAGYLISAGAIRLISDQPPDLARLTHFLDPTTAAKLATGASVAAALYVGRLHFKGPLAQPALLIGCAACVYGGLALFGIPLSAAQDAGWMFRPPSDAAFAPPWELHQWQTFPWHLLPKLVADLAAVTFVAAVSILLNIAGLGRAAHPCLR